MAPVKWYSSAILQGYLPGTLPMSAHVGDERGADALDERTNNFLNRPLQQVVLSDVIRRDDDLAVVEHYVRMCA